MRGYSVRHCLMRRQYLEVDAVSDYPKARLLLGRLYYDVLY